MFEPLIESIKGRYSKLYKQHETVNLREVLLLLKEKDVNAGKSMIIEIRSSAEETEIIVSFHVPSALTAKLLAKFRHKEKDLEFDEYSLIGGESFRAAFFEEGDDFVRMNVFVSKKSSPFIYDLVCQVSNGIFG